MQVPFSTSPSKSASGMFKLIQKEAGKRVIIKKVKSRHWVEKHAPIPIKLTSAIPLL